MTRQLGRLIGCCLILPALGAGPEFGLGGTPAGPRPADATNVNGDLRGPGSLSRSAAPDPVAGGVAQPVSEADLQRWVAVARRGDPHRGERVYRRKELGCVLCHAIGGAGGHVGPDLATLGTRLSLAEIVEAVLVPDKKITQGYHSVLVTTRDELDWSGTFVRETRDELVLRDATNQELIIPKNQIVIQRIGGSIMPAGLVDFLTDGERADLFRFLTELGRPGPFDGTRTTVARAWWVKGDLTPTAENVPKADLEGREWTRIWTTVAGDLPKDDLEAEQASPHRTVPFAVATKFQTTKAGTVRLRFTGPAGLATWIDGTAISSRPEITLKLGPGKHVFVLGLEPGKLPERIRVESAGARFLVD